VRSVRSRWVTTKPPGTRIAGRISAWSIPDDGVLSDGPARLAGGRPVRHAPFAGCSPRQYFAQPAYVEESLDTLKVMRAEQSAMALKVSSLESQLRDQTSRSAEREANLNAELTALNEALERLSGQLENLGEQVQRRARPAPAPAWQPTPPPLPPDESPAASGVLSDSTGAPTTGPTSNWTPPPGNPGSCTTAPTATSRGGTTSWPRRDSATSSTGFRMMTWPTTPSTGWASVTTCRTR
jgi:hypothetical protein